MIRKASVREAKQIYAIIKDYGGKGIMLPRSLNEIYESIRDFLVYAEGSVIKGISSLHIDSEDLAELRSLAVKKNDTGKGVGAKLVKASLQEASEMGIKKVFTLTYVADFFIKLGFSVVDKGEFPHKIWGDCVKCPKFPECDETALTYEVPIGFSKSDKQ